MFIFVNFLKTQVNNMKTDARVRYTVGVLKRSFLELLEQKPVNKISVKEVCERAELNRATFYTHFNDCYDLLECIENDLIADFCESLKYVNSVDVTKLIDAIYDMIERHTDVCRVLVFDNKGGSVIRKMIDIAHDSSIESWRRELKNISDSELEMLYTHLSNGLMHVVVEYYGKYDRETVIRFVSRMVRCSTDTFRQG